MKSSNNENLLYMEKVISKSVDEEFLVSQWLGLRAFTAVALVVSGQGTKSSKYKQPK